MNIQQIKEKIERLKRLDIHFEIFGSNYHEYEFYPTLSEEEVKAFEQKHQISLPEDYRAFLLQIGNGGAGPYYGIFRLAGGDEDDITIYDTLDKAFLFTEEINIWEKIRLEDNPDDIFEECIKNSAGCLYICHYGCALSFFLVVNGEVKGQVWWDGAADRDGIKPIAGNRLSFLEWYEQWLDESLEKFS